MASHLQAAPSPASASQRLADQIHLLSPPAETITYRMLDLEERLAALEATASAASQAGPEVEGVDLRLQETESRLEQLEQLLQPVAAADLPSRRLEAVAAGFDDRLAGGEEDAEQALFPEEGEQAFMDEIVA